jgi:hypothetical protein
VPNFKFLLSDMTALHATVKHMSLIGNLMITFQCA